MSTIIWCRPNATLTNNFITVVGASDADDALRDNNDGTYLSYNGAGAGDSITDVETLSPALGTSRIAAVRVAVRAASGNGSVRFHGQVERNPSGNRGESFYTTTNMGGGPRSIYGAWIKAMPGTSSTEWTEAEINSLRLRMYDDNTGSSDPIVYLARIEVDVHPKPLVQLLNPTSGSITTKTPLVSWSFTASGDAQWKFQVKIFSVAVAEGGGFDPETSANLYDSGVQNYAGTSQWSIPSGILADNTSYYVHVKGASLFPGPVANDFFYSGWAGVKFKTASIPAITVTAPAGAIATAAPIIVWTYSDVDGKLADHYKIRIMTLAAFSAPGNNQDTAPAVYEATIPAPALTHATVGFPLTNSTSYVVSVTAYTVTPFATSGFDIENFNTSWVAPIAPELSAAVQSDFGVVWLNMQGRNNMLSADQSTTEVATGAWITNNATIGQSSAWAANGTKSLEITASSAASMSVVTSPHESLPVVAGKQYTARCTSRAVATARSCTLFIRWFNAAHSQFASDSQTLTNSTSVDTVYAVTAIAPATAVSCDIDFTITSPANAEKHRIDMVGLFPGTPAWNVGGSGPLAGYNLIERSEDGGVHWTPVFNANNVFTDAYEILAVGDYLMTPYTTLQYRASISSSASGVPTSSAYTIVTGLTYTPKVCWLKDPTAPSRNMHLAIEDTDLERTQRRDRVLLRPLGRSRPVSMKGWGAEASFTLKAITLTKAQQDALRLLLNSNKTLLFQSATDNFFCDLSGDYTESDYLWDKLRGNTGLIRQWSIPLVQVDAPSDIGDLATVAS